MTSTSEPSAPVVAGNLCLGTAPDSWGVWFPEDDEQVRYTRFLDELADAGYRWLELGPYGFLPTDPKRLADELGSRGLRVSGGTTAGALHLPQQWDRTLETARAVAQLTAAVGAEHLVFLPPSYRDDATGAYLENPELSTEQWAAVGRAADELGKILLDEHGVRLCVHPHADSHIQTQVQIERLLDETDPRYANLCLDTGHVAYGGGDNVDLIRRYAERIDYVHIKQIDPDVLGRVHEEDLSFGQAVQRGICVEPPAGVPSAVDVVAELAALDAELFVVVEQDLYPCAPETPLPIAERTRQHLESCGLTGQRRPAPRGRVGSR